MSIKIYITNLGKYNEGCLIGQWVKLPVSKDKLKDVLDEIAECLFDAIEEMFDDYRYR